MSIQTEFDKISDVRFEKWIKREYPNMPQWALSKRDDGVYFSLEVRAMSVAWDKQQKKIDSIIELVRNKTPDYELNHLIEGILK